MGIYLNARNTGFEKLVRSKYYVDKTGLIRLTNDFVGRMDRLILVSRPRRFGKTMALSMLKAYYSCGCDSRDLFRGLAIESDPSFEKHLNKHNVISMDMQGLYIKARQANRLDDFTNYISEVINRELAEQYPDEVRGREQALWDSLSTIHAVHGTRFIFLLDEWDVIYRDERHNEALKENYTLFLFLLFRNSYALSCIDLAYLTGILPLPPQALQAGLYNFWVYTALWSNRFRPHFGFTEAEVDTLCTKAQMPVRDIKDWYSGYSFNGEEGEKEDAMFCPYSIRRALDRRTAGNYWGKTGSDAELLYLMNSKDPAFQKAVRDLLAGIPVWIGREGGIDFSNLSTLTDTLTALVHLGYLTYEDCCVHIPNQEVAASFLNTLRRAKSNPANGILSRAKYLLGVVSEGEASEVARLLQENYRMYSKRLSYDLEDNQKNDLENDLAYIIVASYGRHGKGDYTFHRELPVEKGFADIAFLPRKPDRIPILVEMAWEPDVDTAVRQIREGRYAGLAHGYPKALLVEVHFERGDNPKFSCVMEEVENP